MRMMCRNRYSMYVCFIKGLACVSLMQLPFLFSCIILFCRDEKCFVCDECGKSFQRRTSLQKHAINWHESSSAVGPFKCDLCPKKFIRRIYLTNHKLRMHGLDKKFLCQVLFVSSITITAFCLCCFISVWKL